MQIKLKLIDYHIIVFLILQKKSTIEPFYVDNISTWKYDYQLSEVYLPYHTESINKVHVYNQGISMIFNIFGM